MRLSIFKISILIVGIAVLSTSCLLKREDLYDKLNGDPTGQGTTSDPTAGITVDTGDGLLTKEDLSSDTFYVVLNTQPASTVTIGSITSSDTGEVSVSPSSLTFTTSNWDVPQVVIVTGVDDLVEDGLQSVIIDLGIASGGDYTGIVPGDVTVYNLDNETPSSPAVIVITNDGLITREGPPVPTSDSFQVALNSAPGANVTVGTISSTDTGEVTVSTSSLTFTTANWSTPQTVTVNGVDDSISDGMQSVTVNLGNTSSADPNWNGLGITPVTVHNLDDEAPKGISVLAGSTMLVSENGSFNSFEIVLNAPPSANVTIPISSSDPTEGTVSTGSITFTTGNWNTPQTINVTGVDDAAADGNQNFSVVIGAATSGDSDYSGMNPPDVSYMNIDDDIPGITVLAGSPMLVTENGSSSSFLVVLNSGPSADVSIHFHSNAPDEGIVTAPAGGTLTFTSGNWSTLQPVTVSGVNDTEIDANQAFIVVSDAANSTDSDYSGINPVDINFINADDDYPGITVNAGSSLLVSENGGFSSFEIVLNAQPLADVTIPISSSDTTEGTVSTATITFTTANWSAPQSVTVTGANDEVADGNQNFWVVIDASSSGDMNYNGINPGDITCVNVDDDIPGITVNAGTVMLVHESGTSKSFDVVLNSEPAANVDIDVYSSIPAEGTVTAPASGTLTFQPTNWNIPQTVTVTGADDAVVDGNQPFTVILDFAVSTDPNYSGLDPADVDYLNIDGDTTGVKSVSVIAGSTMLVSESGGSAKFEVVLTEMPTANVDINIWSDTPAEGTVTEPAAGTITFTPATWNMPVTVTVSGVDDLIADSNQLFTVVLDTVASADPGYSGFDPADVSFVNVDDDTPGITVLAGSAMTISESGTTSSFEVVLNSEPSASVSIDVWSDDITEGAITTPASGTLTFTSLNWNVQQTVTVTGQDDITVDGNVGFFVFLNTAVSTDPNYNGLNPDKPNVSFINVDDDNPGITVNIGDGLITKEDPVTPKFDIFEIVLNSQPTDVVTIGPIISGDENEVTVSDASITFDTGNWNTPRTITVTGVDDWVVDSMNPQKIPVDLGTASSTDTNYDGMDPGDVTVYNIDDETMPEVIVLYGSSGFITTENGASAHIKLVLNSQPTADVQLNSITSDNVNEGIVDTPSIIFTPSMWDSPQTIIVTGVDDGMDGDGNISYTVDFGFTSSTDPLWNNVDAGGANLTNIDFVSTDDYLLLNNTGTFTSIIGSGNEKLITFEDIDHYDTYAPEDEGFQYVPIGFPFYYMGLPRDSVTVYTNGFLSFSPYHNTANIFVNGFLFADSADTDANLFVDILAPLWDDLTTADAGCSVYYETIGSAPNRVFTIEWSNVRVVGTNDVYTFQLKLYESMNVIEFVYGPSTDGMQKTTACLGIKEGTGGANHFIDAIDGDRITLTSAPKYEDKDRDYADIPVINSLISFDPN